MLRTLKKNVASYNYILGQTLGSRMIGQYVPRMLLSISYANLWVTLDCVLEEIRLPVNGFVSICLLVSNCRN